MGSEIRCIHCGSLYDSSNYTGPHCPSQKLEIGPQRAAPKSVAAINAEVKQLRSEPAPPAAESEESQVGPVVFQAFMVWKCEGCGQECRHFASNDPEIVALRKEVGQQAARIAELEAENAAYKQKHGGE